jgi:phosphatidylglycerophosphatase A
VAALFCCLLWYFSRWGEVEVWLQLALVALLFFVGVVVAGKVEKEWGHDSNRVVIDEAQGILTTLFMVPADWRYALAAFVLFRLFDITKPFGIRRMENFPLGWGVMLDDLLAGIYSALILQAIIQSHLLS